MVAAPIMGRHPEAPPVTNHCYPITVVGGVPRLVGWPTGGEPTRSPELVARVTRALSTEIGLDAVESGTDVGELRLGDDDPADAVVVAYGPPDGR